MLQLGQDRDPALRQFLLPQFEWERYHAARVGLVHLLGFAGLCLWLLLAMGDPLPGSLHRAVLAAWGVCFLAAGFAAMMERRWQRRVRAYAGHLEPKTGGDP